MIQEDENTDNVPYFRRDSEVSSTECQTVYVRQKSNEDLEPEFQNVVVEDSLTKVTALDEDETVAAVDDDMLDDVEMHENIEIVEDSHIEPEIIVEDDGLLGEDEMVLEAAENVVEVNVTAEQIKTRLKVKINSWFIVDSPKIGFLFR